MGRSAASQESSQDDGSLSIRKTQRAPRSCISCSKRRIKCSHDIPCLQCLEKGIGPSCKRETVMVKGQIFHGTSTDKRHADTVEKLLLDNRKLREENNRLRRLMPSQLPGPTSSSSATEAEVARLWSLEGHLPSLFADEDASNLVYRLGFPSLNLDIAGDADDTTPPYELLDTLDDTLDDPDHLTLYLSESLESMAPYISRLLDLVFTHLGWLFAPVQRVHIARDHEALWIDGVLQVDYLSFLIHQEADTLSLYCSLLSVSILYIKQEELGFAIDPDRKLKQARKWFNLSLRLLEHSHYMSSQPRITPLLTFCVLTSEFHTFGQAAYHDNMQAVMLRMGLALRLHRLSQAPRDPVKWTPEEETRRRCWSYLACREGMFLQPGTRFGLHTFDKTPCPHLLNIDQTAMNLVNGKMPKEQPLSVPTDSSFLLAQSRVAWLFNSYRGQLSQTATTDVAYELTLNYDQKLLELHDDMPYFSLRSSPDFVASQHQMRPQWLHAARHIFVLNVLQKRLLLHRHFFALSLQNSAYAKSRALTIESALGILAERRAFSFPFDDVLDTLYNTLTASVALVIDLLCQPAESPTPAGRLQEIEELLCMLRIPSRIPSKHVQKASSLLDDLMLRYRQSTGNMLDMTTQQFPLPWTFPDTSWQTHPDMAADSSIQSISPAEAQDSHIANWLESLEVWLGAPPPNGAQV